MASVEKLCISLRESLWETCGKVLHRTHESGLCVERWVKVVVFHVGVEKFCIMIYTWCNRDKSRLLHSFHKPYYYYY